MPRRKPRYEIVKVQISLFTTGPVAEVLIYNHGQDVFYNGPADLEIIKLMAGYPKRYFKARIKGDVIDLQEVVEDQDW